MTRAGTSMWRGVYAAAGFLTLLPVPEHHARAGHAYATAFFPVVGAGIGGVATLILFGPSLEPTVAAALAVAAMALLTGGLHWDGWADVLDAALAPEGTPRSRRIAILDDSSVGAHAVWGTALLVLVQVLALSRVPWWAPCWGAATGRWVMALTLPGAPPLRPDGAGARLRADAKPVLACFALLLVASGILAAGAPGRALVATLAGAGLAGAVVAWALARRLGGLNGDAHGAVGLLVETSVWIMAAEMMGRVP